MFGLTIPEARSINGNIDLTQLVREKPADMPKLLLSQMHKAAVAAIVRHYNIILCSDSPCSSTTRSWDDNGATALGMTADAAAADVRKLRPEN
jgi:hypothetical protein